MDRICFRGCVSGLALEMNYKLNELKWITTCSYFTPYCTKYKCFFCFDSDSRSVSRLSGHSPTFPNTSAATPTTNLISTGHASSWCWRSVSLPSSYLFLTHFRGCLYGALWLCLHFYIWIRHLLKNETPPDSSLSSSVSLSTRKQLSDATNSFLH